MQLKAEVEKKSLRRKNHDSGTLPESNYWVDFNWLAHYNF